MAKDTRKDESFRFWKCVLVSGIVSCFFALGPSVSRDTLAQEKKAEKEEVDDGPLNRGDVTLNLGIDAASAYYFQGIAQQDQGFIYQPFAEIGLALYKGDGPIRSVDAAVGTWNSVHEENSGDPWYESDFNASLTLGLPLDFSFTTGYTNLYNPSEGEQFSEEVHFDLAFDDSKIFDGIGLHEIPSLKSRGVRPTSFKPYVSLVLETEAGSDGLGAEGDEGVLFLVGVSPGVTVGKGDYPVTFSFPVKVALNLGDYYETASGDDDDETFGYLSSGIGASLPLAFIPKRLGTWTASAMLHILYIGASPREIGQTDFNVSNGNAVELYVTGGVSMEY